MSLHFSSFRSINKITSWTVIWSIIGICTSIILLILQSYETLQYLLANVIEPWLLDVEGSLSTFISALGFIATVIMWIWFYKANKNIHAFGAREITSPTMTLIWWFIPILNLWKPYKVAVEINNASNPRIALSNGNEWKKLQSPEVIKLWWILQILAIIGSTVAAIYWTWSSGFNYLSSLEQPVDLSPSYGTVFYANFAYIFSNILSIASTIFYIRMVKQVSTWQEIKSGRSI